MLGVESFVGRVVDQADHRHPFHAGLRGVGERDALAYGIDAGPELAASSSTTTANTN